MTGFLTRRQMVLFVGAAVMSQSRGPQALKRRNVHVEDVKGLCHFSFASIGSQPSRLRDVTVVSGERPGNPPLLCVVAFRFGSLTVPLWRNN